MKNFNILKAFYFQTRPYSLFGSRRKTGKNSTEFPFCLSRLTTTKPTSFGEGALNSQSFSTAKILLAGGYVLRLYFPSPVFISFFLQLTSVWVPRKCKKRKKISNFCFVLPLNVLKDIN